MTRALFSLIAVVAVVVAPSLAPAAAPSAADVVVMLEQTRVEEATAALAQIPVDDLDRPLAEAYLHFVHGRYDEARDALADSGPAAKALKERLSWLPPRVTGAKEATKDMTEVTKGRFRYRYEGVDQLLVDYAAVALEGQYDAMEHLLAVAPAEPILVEFFSTQAGFVQASGLPPEWVETTGTVAICKWDRMLVLSPMNMPRGYPWLDTLAHEYVHLALSRATHNEAPVWFHEGSAKVLETAWRDGDREDFLSPWTESLVAKALAADALIAFDDMHPSMAALPSDEAAALAFAQVGYAIDYLLDQAGEEGYRRVAAETRRHGDVLRAIDLVLGRSGGGFEKRVTNHIRRSDPQVRANVAGFEPSLEEGAAGLADEEGKALDPVLLADKKMQDLTRVGDLLRLRGHVRAALLEYEKAEAAGAFHSPALANKQARALRSLGRDADAARVLRRSLELYPEYTPAVALLFAITAQTDDVAGAIALGERAIGLNPFDPEVHGTLGVLYEKQGDEAKAKRERDAIILIRGG